MSQNAAILAQIAQMEASLAQMRKLLTGDAAMTPTKVHPDAEASSVPTKSVGVDAPLSDADLEAMVKAGVKASAHTKSLGKTVFKAIGIAENEWANARAQWKAYREAITDEEATLEENEPVLDEGVLENLKNHGEYNAKTQTRKLSAEFTDYGIHPVLHAKAAKEWREFAEKNGLGERSKAPKRTASAKAPKKVLPALLDDEKMEVLKNAGFHSGSQKRKLADTLTGFGIEEKEHARAAKEWREWAKARGIDRSASSSHAGSEGVPESVGPVSTDEPILKPERFGMLVSYGTKEDVPTETLNRWFGMWGIPNENFAKAEAEWREWAKANDVGKMEPAMSASEASASDELELDLEA